MKPWLLIFLLAEVVMTGMPEFVRAVEIIGHRGASRDAPENTLASVNLAWKRNADAVEIDVYLSKDGHIVVVHDETTKRYGGPDRKIADQTLADLKKLELIPRTEHHDCVLQPDDQLEIVTLVGGG